tara:strand:+ start:49 stop:402 length:354 start_codon:yes stop_codon:yes gene_type:complete
VVPGQALDGSTIVIGCSFSLKTALYSRPALPYNPTHAAADAAAGHAQVAQLVEQRIENPRVGGSNPPLGTIFSEAVAAGPIRAIRSGGFVVFGHDFPGSMSIRGQRVPPRDGTAPRR